MNYIITTASSFVILIILSFFLKHIGILKVEDKVFLGNILMFVNLPCVIISGFKDFEYDNSLLTAIFLAIGVSLISIAIGFVLSLKKTDEEKTLHMMTCSGYNIGIFTIPFVSSFLSSSALVCTLMFDMGNAIMVFGTTAAITSAIVFKKKENPIPALLKRMFKTIPFVTYILMLILLAFNITLPDFVYSVTDLGSNSTAYLAMIMIGIMIEFKIDKSEIRTVVSAIIARYALALVASFFVYSLSFDIEIRKAIIIALFSPFSTASVVLTQKLGCKYSSVGMFSSLSIIISMVAIIGIVILL